MMYFPAVKLPPINLEEAEIAPDYIQIVIRQWEKSPPDIYFKHLLRATPEN